MELAREERLAVVADRVDLEPVQRHLLLHLATPRTIAAEAELAAAAAVSTAHAEMGLAGEADGTAAGAEEVAPRELLSLRPSRRAPAALLARRLPKPRQQGVA